MSLRELIEGMQHTQLFKTEGGHLSNHCYRCLLKDALPAHEAQVRIDYEATIPHDSCCDLELAKENGTSLDGVVCDCPKAERERKNALP